MHGANMGREIIFYQASRNRPDARIGILLMIFSGKLPIALELLKVFWA